MKKNIYTVQFKRWSWDEKIETLDIVATTLQKALDKANGVIWRQYRDKKEILSVVKTGKVDGVA